MASERVLQEGRYEGETSMVPHGRPGPWSPGLEDKNAAKAGELLEHFAEVLWVRGDRVVSRSPTLRGLGGRWG